MELEALVHELRRAQNPSEDGVVALAQAWLVSLRNENLVEPKRFFSPATGVLQASNSIYRIARFIELQKELTDRVGI